MIIVLQVAGVVAVLVGLATIGYGIPIREFSFGNLLIVVGTIGLCTGMILLGLSVVALEFRTLARRLTVSAARSGAEPRARTALPPFPPQPGMATGEPGPAPSREPPMPPNAGQGEASVAPPVAPPPLEGEPGQAAAASPSAQSPRQRRNLLFSSTVRRDGERPAGRPGDPASPDRRGPAPPGETSETPPASFEEAWPKPDRGRSAEVSPQRRAGRPGSVGEPTAGAAPEHPVPPTPAPAPGEPGPTVLKSGIVDGMAYSLYSDGSIEAQMPEGMMRFASIDELRAHLDQRS